VLCGVPAPSRWVNRRWPGMSLPLADFAGALPLLEEPRRAWLRRALRRVHPGHEWLDALG